MKLDLLTNAAVVDDAIRFVVYKEQQGFGKSKEVIICKVKEEQDNKSPYLQLHLHAE
jgi:hypothetical protein